jgi:hypothetical protein
VWNEGTKTPQNGGHYTHSDKALHNRRSESSANTAMRILHISKEEEGMVSQNTTVIFGGAFYLG